MLTFSLSLSLQFLRYFFKSFCEDIAMEIMEEYSENSAILPLIEGKIIGRVEKLA